MEIPTEVFRFSKERRRTEISEMRKSFPDTFKNFDNFG